MLKLSFLNRFLLLMSLLVVGILKGYSQNDFDKPILSEYTVSPSSVDISSGTQTLTLNIRASDASGVVTPTSYGAYISFNSNYFYGSTWSLVSGDRFNGVYESILTLDSSSLPSGNYSIEERNWEFKDPSGYQSDGINNAQITVVNNSTADFDKPILSEYTVSPSSVDISSGTQTLTLNIRASDASGVVTPTSYGAYISFNSNYFYGSTWSLVSGDRFNGVYESILTLDSSSLPSGNYSIEERNWEFKDPSGYQSNGINNAQITVVNNSTADFDKPILSEYTVSPSSVDISSGTQTLTLNIRASDASGVVTPTSYGAYISFNSNYFYGSTWSLVSGDRFNGVYESILTLDSSSLPSGNYSIEERNWEFKDPSGYQSDGINNAQITVVNYSGTSTPSIGNGSSSSPFQIDSFSDLWWISQNSNRWIYHYIQTANIDASSTSYLDSGQGFTPIGNSTTRFTGSYDGQGFSIENLFINRPIDSEIGMFGFVNNGIVKNIQLWDSNITGDTRVGAIAGALTNSSGQFSGNNVYDGFVLGNTTTGGLIGRLANNSHIHASSYIGTVTGYSSSQNFSGSGTPQNIGGIVGKMQGGSVLRKSFFDGHVFGINYVGGIAGVNSGSEISNSYSTGTITAEDSIIGGITGNSGYDNNDTGRVHNFTSSVITTLNNSSNVGPVVGGQTLLPMKVLITFGIPI